MSQELICVPVILKTPAQANMIQYKKFILITKKSMIFRNIPSPELYSIVKPTLIHCNSYILGLYVEKYYRVLYYYMKYNTFDKYNKKKR